MRWLAAVNPLLWPCGGSVCIRAPCSMRGGIAHKVLLVMYAPSPPLFPALHCAAPTLADLDDDGKLEIIMGTSMVGCCCCCCV
jgi:hypothetical protein